MLETHLPYLYHLYIPQLNAEFLRISTIPLKARFMQKLDEKCSELMQIIRKKEGAIREKTNLLPTVQEVRGISIYQEVYSPQ